MVLIKLLCNFKKCYFLPLVQICQPPYAWATESDCCDSPWRGHDQTFNCNGGKLQSSDPNECCGGQLESQSKCLNHERVCQSNGKNITSVEKAQNRVIIVS